MRHSALAFLSIVCLSATAACAASSDDGESSQDAISRPALKERFADLRKINTDQLKEIGARLAVNEGANQLNKALSIKTKYVELGIDIKPTRVYGAAAERLPIIPDSGEVQSLADIRQGLASDLGEKELPTELAKLRLDHLAKGEDKFYVETGFGLGGALKLDWAHPAGGFGPTGTVSVAIGFRKGESVESRLVVASPSSKLSDLIELNGEAIKALRGFVVPEKIEEIKSMKPGEMVGLRGKGTFGANFGVGVPILVANAGPFAYTIAVSAGLSHAVEGMLDVTMVRLAGDEVAVDVGMSDGKVDSASVGIFGGFGLNHLCSDGRPCLDNKMGGIVQKALLRQLSGFLQTSISAGTSKTDNRLELARMRFHLNQPEVPEALQQALHGDLRHAQALYSRNLDKTDPPVKFDFDMMRAATTASRTFGAKIFGVDIFHKSSSETEGSFAVQTPNGVQNVLWDSFQKNSGFFNMDSGSKITALSSAATDAKDPDKTNNRANLIIQSVVGDKHMDDDVLIDSADGLIAMIAGAKALEPLDKFGSAMQAAVAKCPTTDQGACSLDLIQDDSKKVVDVGGTTMSLSEARTQGLNAFKSQSSVTALPKDYQALLTSAAELRLTMHAIQVFKLDVNSPRVSFALNYRLDEKAMNALANVDPQKYRDAVRTYLTTVATPRTGFSDSTLKEKDMNEAIEGMSKALETYKQRFLSLSATESEDLPRVLAGKPFAKLPIGVRFDVSDVADANSEERMAKFIDDEKRIRVESISHQRAIIGKDLFDGLVASAKEGVDFSNRKGWLFKEQAAAYPLLAVIALPNLEVGMDVGADLSSDFFHKRDRFVKAGFQAVSKSAHGDKVEPITGKMFDIDAMMGFVVR